MHRWLLLLGVSAALAACRHAAEPATAARPPEPLPDDQPATEASSASGAEHPSAKAAAPPPPGRVLYDLAAHVERAELRRGRQVLMDYGVPGDAKYTLGGWQSGSGDAIALGDARVRLVPGTVARLALPAPGPGAATLALSLRSFEPGPLTVHLNGETLADRTLTGEALERLELDVPAGLLQAGDNTLQLRVKRTGSVNGGRKAGIALDWVALAPAGETAVAPPAAESLSPGADLLALPAQHSLGYALIVPERAELRARLTSGSLSIVALRDGKPPLPLGKPGTAPAELRVDLGALAGQLVQLELSASAGDARLERPRIVTPKPAAAPAQKPVKNVIIVLIDTLRADKLSPYRGETRVKTPGLSTFLRDSAVMRSARSPENWTKPSVATLLSSLLPWQHNAVTGDAKVPDSVELLPELLGERGFHTGSFIANGYVSDKFGFKQGWNTYRNYIREGRRTKAQYVRADVLDWLDSRPKDKPFFLYMHTIDPHVPYRPPQSFVDMYHAQPYSGVVNFSKTAELLEKIKIGSLKVREPDRVYLEALYDAEISYHDVHFAAVMEGLEKRGLADETMVVVTSDHGEEFWDHGSVGHGHSVYDELLHVPLIVRIPGLTAGKQQVFDSVSLVDVMPTVLDALGQPVPEHLMGRSFLPELRGDDQSAPRFAVSGFMDAWRTLAVGKLKYVQRTTREQRLYDLDKDPDETADLAAERPLALRYTRGLLGLGLAEHERAEASGKTPARKHKKEKTVIDKQTEEQLRALGYVGTSAK